MTSTVVVVIWAVATMAPNWLAWREARKGDVAKTVFYSSVYVAIFVGGAATLSGGN